MTLTDKLAACFESDEPTGFDWAETWVGRPETGEMSNRELDLRDWGLYYGVAYGIARGEDPYETNASVAERAYEAAWAVFGSSRLAGDPPLFSNDEPAEVPA